MLAESWTYLDSNNVEIKLKPNVPFHDGHILNADDVKFSLEREMQSGFSSHLTEVLGTCKTTSTSPVSRAMTRLFASAIYLKSSPSFLALYASS